MPFKHDYFYIKDLTNYICSILAGDIVGLCIRVYRHLDIDILTGILRGIVDWMYHRLCRENLGVMMRGDVVNDRLNDDGRIYEIDIDFDYCDEILKLMDIVRFA